MAFIFALLCLPLNALPTTDVTALPTEATAVTDEYTEFEDMVPYYEDDGSGIWKGYDETYISSCVSIHINSIDGYLFLQEALANPEVTFYSDYKYLLDDNLDLTGYEPTLISSEYIKGIFDGQGHTITYDGYYLFDSVRDFTLQNITIEGISAPLICSAFDMCRISHIKIKECGNLCANLHGKLIISDLNFINREAICDTLVGTTYTDNYGRSEIYMTDSVIIADGMCLIIDTYDGEGFADVILNNVLIDVNYLWLCQLLEVAAFSSFTCTGCEFYINKGNGSSYCLFSYTHDYNITFYDCAFNCLAYGGLFFEGGEYFPSYYWCNYQGVYVNGEAIESSFTPSKWFTGADGQPHLRHFYWAGQVN